MAKRIAGTSGSTGNLEFPSTKSRASRRCRRSVWPASARRADAPYISGDFLVPANFPVETLANNNASRSRPM